MSDKARQRAEDEAFTMKFIRCCDGKGDSLSCLCGVICCVTCLCLLMNAEVECRYMFDDCIHQGKTVNSGSKENRPPETTNTMKGTISDVRIENIVKTP